MIQGKKWGNSTLSCIGLIKICSDGVCFISSRRKSHTFYPRFVKIIVSIPI